MRLATLRRRGDTLPGVSGVARLDRRTARLATRLNRGDIAVIDHVDLDRVTAEVLADAGPAAVVNAQPLISGRYPNLGPQVLAERGIVLLDNAGPEIFAAAKEGAKLRVDGTEVYLGEKLIATGTEQDMTSIELSMVEAKAGLASQLEAFALDTAQFMTHERDLLIDGVGIPEIRTRMRRRHAVVVVRGPQVEKDLKRLRPYIREYHPVLVGVDGGADALLEAGMKPSLIVGDMDAVSDAALGSGAEVVVHAYPDGRAPGLLRVQDLGIDAITFPTSGTSEDAAMLLADDGGAEVVVTVGTHATLTEFLDRGRAGMASSFLTRLRLGAKVVDARTATQLYRTRVSAGALLLLVIAALVAIVAAAAVATGLPGGGTDLSGLGHSVTHLLDSVQDSFS